MQQNVSINKNILKRIIKHPELINQEFLLIELNRAAEDNGFMVAVEKFDKQRNPYDMKPYSYGYGEESETILIDSDDIDFKERTVNPGGLINGFLSFHSNRTRDGIHITDDYFTDIAFVFYNSGNKIIKVDGKKVQPGNFFIETIATKERKQRHDSYIEAFDYLLKHYNDPDFEKHFIDN